MAWAYHIYRIDPGRDIIAVEHIFYGHTKAECIQEFNEHLRACSGLCAAENEERIEEEWEEIDPEQIPVPSDDEEEEEQ